MDFEKDLQYIELCAELYWRNSDKKYLTRCMDVKYKYAIFSAKFLICEAAYLLGSKRYFLGDSAFGEEKKEVELLEKVIQIAIKELNSNE